MAFLVSESHGDLQQMTQASKATHLVGTLGAVEAMPLAYPHFACACFAIMVDANAIHGQDSIKRWADDYSAWVKRSRHMTLVESWCATLTESQLIDWAVNGEIPDANPGLSVADQVLDDYWTLRVWPEVKKMNLTLGSKQQVNLK